MKTERLIKNGLVHVHSPHGQVEISVTHISDCGDD